MSNRYRLVSKHLSMIIPIVGQRNLTVAVKTYYFLDKRSRSGLDYIALLSFYKLSSS